MQSPDTASFMDPTAGTTGGSLVAGLDSLQLDEEIHQIMTAAHENESSFTALLELPATQAMELLHLSESDHSPTTVSGRGVDDEPRPQSFGTLTFSSSADPLERAARFSVAASELNGNIFSVTSLVPSNSRAHPDRVKVEPAETESSQRLVSDPTEENQSQGQNKNNRPAKRKEREDKAKGSTKKTKSYKDAEKLPYVHVRARRGQATDSHSLAERARREKINARMKLLQELVPGCNKVQGTALVLEEIISHVQSLQRQVELLSMRLAAVNPGIDHNLDNILAAGSGSIMESNFTSMVMPMMWADCSRNRQAYHQQPQYPFDFHQSAWGREEDHHNFIPSDNLVSSYASLRSDQVKKEL